MKKYRRRFGCAPRSRVLNLHYLTDNPKPVGPRRKGTGTVRDFSFAILRISCTEPVPFYAR